MASIPQAFRTDNAFLNPLSDGGAGRIQRTTEVDMEWDRDGENIREHGELSSMQTFPDSKIFRSLKQSFPDLNNIERASNIFEG